MEKLNLPPFYIGQTVVCTKGHPQYGLIEGSKYTLTDIILCSCGETTVSYGVESGHSVAKATCSECRHILSNKNTQWYCRSVRFAPIQESKFKAVTFEKICEEVELICEN